MHMYRYYAAQPQIYINPKPHGGAFSLEQNRRAKLECLVDQESYPPVTSLRSPSKQAVLKYAEIKWNLIIEKFVVSSFGVESSMLDVVPLCSSVNLYETQAAQVIDSGTYCCEDNGVGVDITVEGENSVIVGAFSLSHRMENAIMIIYAVKALSKSQIWWLQIPLWLLPGNLEIENEKKVGRKEIREEAQVT